MKTFLHFTVAQHRIAVHGKGNPGTFGHYQPQYRDQTGEYTGRALELLTLRLLAVNNPSSSSGWPRESLAHYARRFEKHCGLRGEETLGNLLPLPSLFNCATIQNQLTSEA